MPRKPFQVPASVRKGLPQFVRKLVEILETAPKQIVEWTRDGTAFAVHNLPRFCSEVLGRHFRSSQFNSFMRQLNFYNFRKVDETDITPGMEDREPPRTTEFTHAHLRRGDWTRLRQIKRKTSSEYHVSYEVELKALKAENAKLKQELAAAHAHARTMQEQRDLARARARAVLDAARSAGMTFGGGGPGGDALMALHEVADEVEVEELDDLDMGGVGAGGNVASAGGFGFYGSGTGVGGVPGSGAGSMAASGGGVGVNPAAGYGTGVGGGAGQHGVGGGADGISAGGMDTSAAAGAWATPQSTASTALVTVPKRGGRTGRPRMRLPAGAAMRVPRLPPAAGSGSSSLVRMRHNKRRRTASPGRAGSLSPSLGVSADPTTGALTYMPLAGNSDAWRNANVNQAIASLFEDASPGSGGGGYGDVSMVGRLRNVGMGNGGGGSGSNDPGEAMGGAIDLDALGPLDGSGLGIEVGARTGHGSGGGVASAHAGQRAAQPFRTTRLGPPPRGGDVGMGSAAGVGGGDPGAMSPLGLGADHTGNGSSHGRGMDSGDWSLDFGDGDLSWLDLSPSALPPSGGASPMGDGDGMDGDGGALDAALDAPTGLTPRPAAVPGAAGAGAGVGVGVGAGGVDVDAAPLWRGISAISLDSAAAAAAAAAAAEGGVAGAAPHPNASRDVALPRVHGAGGSGVAGSPPRGQLSPALTPLPAGGGGPDPAVATAAAAAAAAAATNRAAGVSAAGLPAAAVVSTAAAAPAVAAQGYSVPTSVAPVTVHPRSGATAGV